MTTYPDKPLRTPLLVTISVWQALFLREANTRLSSGRGSTVWLLGEPILHTVIMLLLFTFLRVKVVGGIDVLAWLIIGLTFFKVFKNPGTQGQNAISANKVLFTYRQVKPVDTVLVRVFLEGFLVLLVILIIASAAIGLFNVALWPDDMGMVVLAFFGLWLMGLGYALITSVAIDLIPELGKIFNIMMTPLYMGSGAIIPLSGISEPYRSWLMYNPMAHGLEVARAGVSSSYHVILGTNIAYLYECALVAIFFGLALHLRFQTKLLTQ
ncbi:ABC transporter permease [Methylovulum psychrotolerans]|jgi:capsular polysaccharide transport system permease protein|uniref:ABC transporter n=1 Tax=Methylovulum psychrotolerans TaxID=1704499 RepID=A0A2S5CMH6_9GAMM|nr:ABC transporter permease [Methylovulum psychrotolerans]POZ51978.1 ABC transporter [Methylovulum psychrotolerans]